MIKKVFAVYDSKSLVYGSPFFMNTMGEAVRAFTDAVNENGSMLNKHPKDFILYHIGEYDDAIGKMIPQSPHQQLGHGSDFVQIQNIIPDLAVRDNTHAVITNNER